MKNAYTILSHLQRQPQFKNLKQHECYRKYIKLLGEKYQRAIAFIYVKHNALYIAVTHPGFKMELNYNKDLLKEVLTRFISIEKNCDMLQADDIIIFHSRYHKPPNEAADNSTIPRYEELAEGHFEIAGTDSRLQEKFKTLKQIIKRNR